MNKEQISQEIERLVNLFKAKPCIAVGAMIALEEKHGKIVTELFQEYIDEKKKNRTPAPKVESKWVFFKDKNIYTKSKGTIAILARFQEDSDTVIVTIDNLSKDSMKTEGYTAEEFNKIFEVPTL